VPGLDLVSVSKSYDGGRRAVDGVSLRIEPGELLVLVDRRAAASRACCG
jgi:ABC-type multidrug transport system ATPase subunit